MEIKYTAAEINAAYRGAISGTNARWLAAVEKVRAMWPGDQPIQQALDALVRLATGKEERDGK